MPTSLTAEDVRRKLKEQKVELGEKSMSLLVGTEKVSWEVQKLGLAVQSEILDVGAGTGTLSTLLQTHGFTNIDVLEEDITVLRNLRSLRLYREHICKSVTDLNSTGLRDGSYDVIVTSYGIGSHCISPTQITELLRILKNGGHLFFTVNYTSEKSADIGLLNRNLKTFEKERRCSIMKKETFYDFGSIPIGMFYILVRLPASHPMYLDKPVSKGLEETLTKILVGNCDLDSTIKYYDAWSDKYNEEVEGHYTGHVKCVDAFLQLDLDRNIQILDVAAGTGLLGAELAKHGYRFIDAIDSSWGMLLKARKQNIYKEYIHARVGNLQSIPVNDQTYDAILMSNGFAPGHIYPSALIEMLRVLRPGGYLIWTMRDGLHSNCPQFAMMDSDINDLVRDKVVERMFGPVLFDKYMQDCRGRFYMLKKTSGGA